MQQFIVPQFIEVEDRIFGPITVRQFSIILVGGIFVFLAYRFADFALFIFTLILVGGLSLVFAFVKINGQSFHYFVLNIVQTLRRPSRRIWRKHYEKSDLDFLRNALIAEVVEKKVQKVAKRGHIRDLALLVNTGGFYKPEEDL